MTDAQKAACGRGEGQGHGGHRPRRATAGAAEDRVASRYFAEMKAKGKQAPASQMAVAAPAATAKDAKAAPKK
jgi:hypothetical protein